MLEQTRRQFLRGAAFAATCALVARPAMAREPATNGEPMTDHERWMRRALECGARNPRAPFGSVVVDRIKGEEVAWGVNHTVDGPIWHGEMDALQACPARHQDFSWGRLALYTTAEPCAMCQSAILWARVPLVVYGTSIATLETLGWDQIRLSSGEVAARSTFHHCRILGGVLSAECDETFRAAIELRKVEA